MRTSRAIAVLLALAVGTSILLTARSSNALPYTKVQYSVGDAERAFATERVKLTVRSRDVSLTDLSSRSDVYEVTVFGQPDAVRKTGFRDLPHGRDCSVAGHLALHWRGNVRAILNCDLVRNDKAWIARMDRALSALR